MNGQHRFPGFLDGGAGQRQVDGHLVTIKVRVKGGTDQRMDADSRTINQHRLKGLDGKAMQRRGAVEQHRTVFYHIFQDVIDLRPGALHQPAGAFNVGRQPVGDQTVHDERFKEFQRHAPRQAALV